MIFHLSDRDKPASEYTRTDEFGTVQFKYACRYRHNDMWCDLDIWATSVDDAEMRVRSISRSLGYVGQLWQGV